VIRRRALDVARLDQGKGSLSAKLKRSAWNDEFMLKRPSHVWTAPLCQAARGAALQVAAL